MNGTSTASSSPNGSSTGIWACCRRPAYRKVRIASRSTRRPITFAPLSTCSIDSAGTSRRRRASHPERTDSASGVSGEVPYIGHSTRPTTRPRASATRNPAVRRRSTARALTIANLFPACEENPPRPVKVLLVPFSGHGEPRHGQHDEVDGRQSRDEASGDRLPAAPPPERRAEGGEQHDQTGLEHAVADPQPSGVRAGEVLVALDPVRAGEGQHPGGKRGDERRERNPRQPGEGGDQCCEHDSEERHRPEEVEKQGKVPRRRPDGGDHWPGFQTIRTRTSRMAAPDAQESALPTGSRTSARSSSVAAAPEAARRSASSRAFAWRRPPRPPRALPATHSTIAPHTQNVPYE